MTKPMLASQQNTRSRRWAVVSDEGASVWLYLTERGSTKPIADCWLLNTVPPPADLEEYRAVKAAPPVIRSYAGPGAQGSAPVDTAIQFHWSLDGDSVAVFVGGELLGFIAVGNKHGFSRHLVAAGPFGQPLDKELYTRLFNQR